MVAGIPRSIVADLTFVQKFDMPVCKKNAVGIVVAVGDLCTVRIIYIRRIGILVAVHDEHFSCRFGEA